MKVLGTIAEKLTMQDAINAQSRFLCPANHLMKVRVKTKTWGKILVEGLDKFFYQGVHFTMKAKNLGGGIKELTVYETPAWLKG